MARTPSSDAEPRVDTRFLRKEGLSKPRFEEVFQKGKRATTANFRIGALPGEGRIGIGTAKKIGCHARRNWVKRRIRESIASLESHLEPKLDYILIATPNVVDLSFESIRTELETGLDRIAERWAEALESS